MRTCVPETPVEMREFVLMVSAPTPACVHMDSMEPTVKNVSFVFKIMTHLGKGHRGSK